MSDAAERDPAAVACQERTRSAVLNILVVMGGGIAVSGWALGRLDRGAFIGNAALLERGAFTALLAIVVFSHTWLRIGTGRTALRDPERRATRYYRAHVIAALIAALAVPLGYAY